jgi:hypothetical protein
VSLIQRFGRFLRADRAGRGAMLGGFVDSLLQTFENCRHGLSDDTLARPREVEAFFLALYEKEKSRLQETIHVQEQHLSEPDCRELFERLDERMRQVVIPAYVRLTQLFTRRERNDFYLTRGALHGAERLAWAVGGMAVGGFVVWAPFIPLWSKEWVLLFTLAGLVFPDLRRFLAQRRYQAELNALVARTDDDIWRMDLAYLTDHLAERARAAPLEPSTEPESEGPPLEVPRTETPRSSERRVRQGDR